MSGKKPNTKYLPRHSKGKQNHFDNVNEQEENYTTFFIHHFHNKFDAKQQPFSLKHPIKVIFPTKNSFRTHSNIKPYHCTLRFHFFVCCCCPYPDATKAFTFLSPHLLHFLTPFGIHFFSSHKISSFIYI